MFLWLATFLSKYFHFFNVIQYLTLRSIFATLTALFVALFIGPYFIRKLANQQIGQVVRDDGPSSHLSKAGTPTMGGGLILASIAISTLLWCKLDNLYVWLLIAVLIAFGFIGWVDDYKKLTCKNSRGLQSRWKYFWQSLFAILIGIFLYFHAKFPAETQLIFPFFKHLTIDLGWLYIVWVYFVIVGSSNAVNLTDGLDGLAIFPSVLIAGALGVFAYLTGNIKFASYLYIPYIHGMGEVSVICGAISGAGLGFLWYNTYPAMVFMGDIGSLGLGALLGTIAVIVRQELAFALMSGVFIVETLSVILQVLSFKLTGKRIFKMAPIHHHFELKGWPEPRVIVRFWIISFMLVLLGLATLKLR